MINSIKSNTISEANVKKKINELNKIKKVEINGKKLIESKKTLLSLSDNLLKTIFKKADNENKTVNKNNSNTKNKSKSDNKTDNENNSSTKNKTVNESKNDNDSDNNSESESENEGKNKKDGYYYNIKQLNNWFKKIDQTTSLEDQIKILKTKIFLDEYWRVSYYNDNKKLNYKLFKAKAAYLLNDLGEHLFEKIFDCKFTTLAEKLINTLNKKEENQIIIDDIKNNKDKISTKYKYDTDVIRQSADLLDAVKIILEINEILKSDKVNNNNNNNNNNDLMKVHKI